MNSLLKYTCLLFFLTAASCKQAADKAVKNEPATMNHPAATEQELNSIRLTNDAVRRLGIQLVSADSAPVANKRTFSAEVMAIPGQTVSLTAPVSGTLLAIRPGLAAGMRLKRGDAIFNLAILPSEKDAIAVNEDIVRLEQQYEVVQQKVERAANLYREQAGSLRAQQEAESEFAAIAAQLRVAKARKELLQGNTASSVTSKISTLSIKSPINGVLQKLYGTPNQVMAAASPIADVATTDKLWVRVPVYAGDINRIDRHAVAAILSLSDFSGSSATVAGKPVQGPQTADPLNTSIDLFYEIANRDGVLAPGSRVSIQIPYKSATEGIVIPYSAVVYDIHGGSWIYVNTDSLLYTRQRVEIASVSGQNAVIKRGLSGREKVVTAGAAELFGFEFGGGK
ncbi:MAG: efflux RND transporter periplasmic adaptor subunit [Luteolibacter sp.]